MTSVNGFLLVLLWCFSHVCDVQCDSYSRAGHPCYDEHGKPQRCVPDFVNAAFNVKVDVTNTCGEDKPEEFCVQTGAHSHRKTCDICDSRVPLLAHTAESLTDFNEKENATWWQSETMAEGIQFPNSVNLTLKLGKTFDISYVRLKFLSPRPESFAIYKKTKQNSEWVPWQFYSGTCRTTYGVPDRAPILRNRETVAQCTSEYSDISPLTSADIAFSTRDGRPSAQRVDSSDVLQEWVTASEIKVSLNRLNTFGDEVFADPKVLRSYYYAISDLAVGGRCLCNGHSSECVKSTGGGEERLVCRCEHHTAGADCDQCEPFYNDRQWMRATADNANECKACNCSGLSRLCQFDAELYRSSGSGGRCLNCEGNTHGAHCEHCLANFYPVPNGRGCTACGCNEIGSASLQCDGQGQCSCKAGVGGQHCDRCLPNHYDFSPQGCKSCGCVEAGSSENQPQCHPTTGDCVCKSNVEGRKCDRCKPGFFALSTENPLGCLSCFCHGHSSICESAPGYHLSAIESSFQVSAEGWKVEMDQSKSTRAVHHPETHSIAATMDRRSSSVSFVAPEKFLGDQRKSYAQFLKFSLHVSDYGARASVKDVVIEGANGQSIYAPIFAQNNQIPSTSSQMYQFRLHEDSQFQWNPRLSGLEFITILSNISAIRIRAGYTPGGSGHLSEFRLGSASDDSAAGETSVEATHVEMCQCPTGFEGQFCQSCKSGYRRDPRFGGSFAKCILCRCHGHTTFCDAESGKCSCNHNTAGDQCERCERGFYGNAIAGTPSDCTACPCPNNSPCLLHTDGDVICLDCPKGYAGRKCELCADGFYDTNSNRGPSVMCKPCQCNNNIDTNSIGNCDRISGECKKCIHDTFGFHCEKCLPGFFGDAIIDEPNKCKPCGCSLKGSSKANPDVKVLECRSEDGQCDCFPHVVGKRCDQCEPGYFNLKSGTGCESCNCDVIGSSNSTCEEQTGQCHCKPGVTGRRCDQCAMNTFGFNTTGCANCDCKGIGSANDQCDLVTGQCQCRKDIEGRRCDRCVENKFDLQGGCRDCPPCYKLIQKKVNEHREKLNSLQLLLDDIRMNPTVVNDTNFDLKLIEVQRLVDQVGGKLKTFSDGGSSAGFAHHVEEIGSAVKSAESVLENVMKAIAAANHTTDGTVKQLKKWDRIKGQSEAKVQEAQLYLDTTALDAWAASEKAGAAMGNVSTNLAHLAAEARLLSQRSQKEAEEMREFAAVALNTSKKAQSEAQAAVTGGDQENREIDEIRQKLMDAEDKFNKTRQMASEQNDKIDEVHKQSAEILTRVATLALPSATDPSKRSEDATDTSQAALAARMQAEKLSIENRDAVANAEAVAHEASREYQEANNQQQEADEILADLDAARQKAEQAVQLADQTLTDANRTLQTIAGFDQLVESSRIDAQKALRMIGEIDQSVKEAENQTATSQKALGDAAENARSAASIAADAQTVAEATSAEAMRVKGDAARALHNANGLATEVETFRDSLGGTTGITQTLNNYMVMVDENKRNTQEILQQAEQARNSGRSANRTAEKAVETVKKILDELGSVETVSDAELDALEEKLRDATDLLAQVDLDTQLESLKEKSQQQQQKVNTQKNEIDRLQAEVDAIGQIRNSLPQQCFNAVRLENE